MDRIDYLYSKLSPENKKALVDALNVPREKFFFVDGEYVGVHVTSTHLIKMDERNHWSYGVERYGENTKTG